VGVVIIKVFTISGKLIKIDDEDSRVVESHTWCLNRGKFNYGYYVMCGIRKGGTVRKLYLHRIIAKAGRGERVYFKNGDTLDCRRNNLRKNK